MSNIDIIADRIAERKIDSQLEMAGAEKNDFAGLTYAEKSELLRKVQNSERCRSMSNSYPSYPFGKDD